MIAFELLDSENGGLAVGTAAVPTSNPPFSESGNSTAIMGILPDVTGSRFFKMAATKPEVITYQLPDQILTLFQRITHIFGVQQLKGNNGNFNGVAVWSRS